MYCIGSGSAGEVSNTTANKCNKFGVLFISQRIYQTQGARAVCSLLSREVVQCFNSGPLHIYRSKKWHCIFKMNLFILHIFEFFITLFCLVYEIDMFQKAECRICTTDLVIFLYVFCMIGTLSYSKITTQIFFKPLSKYITKI